MLSIQKEEIYRELKPMSVSFQSRKQIRCPKCGKRLMDTAADVRTEVKILSGKSRFIFDYFAKCERCRTEIGIRKLS